ncbi:oligoribonuclease [Aspergillus novofumigatus IBT 16806]|uniref:RNA exonuclease Rex2 n=1 Tax=Aspergillus novofumigatus (strain IBT 16806) TaxID=1392255 RepID=A0A2I1C3J2_ASPN1|nr:RNA exonuclease Rex2 [Aspergillus novofumigatus IBT 16806]PKX92204.1 RNA exonuclease Rex2 [Aspergillus novofumigatus IBT 16806]
MTGLNPERDTILQICCYITDANLNLLDPEGFETIIYHDRSVLDSMSPWCVDTHGRTGLTAARYVPRPRTALLAGNSVHADKMFLAKEPYKAVLEWLHYRILDVSAFKEAARREVPPKKEVHLAREDILESIEEMRFYKERLFRE